jgi:prepilin peptidase CpaA
VTPAVGIAAGLGATALVEDLLCRRVPHWLTTTGTVCGLVFAARNSWHGLAIAAAGAMVGLLILLPLHWWGGLGDGGVRLMAAYGALLGPTGILLAAVFAAAIGGLSVAGTLLLGPRTASSPYASAIVLGAWVSLLGGGL